MVGCRGASRACTAVEHSKCIGIDVLNIANVVGIVRIPTYIGSGLCLAIAVLTPRLSSNNAGHTCAENTAACATAACYQERKTRMGSTDAGEGPITHN